MEHESIMSDSGSEVPSKRMRKDDEDWGESAPSFNKLIRNMFTKRILTDVIIKIESENGSQEIECHSFILFAHSPVLTTMISDRWTEGSDKNNPKVITVTGDNPDDFKNFVQMMYWDWNEQTFEEYSDPDSRDLTPEIIVGVLSLAHKYLASHLIRRSEHEIFCYLVHGNIDDHISLYTLLRRLPICDAGQVARKIYRTVESSILSQGKDIFKDNVDINKLSYSDLLNIVFRNELQCLEDEIYKGCYRWAVEQCDIERLPVTGEGVRACLGDIIKSIRFPLMNKETLTDVVLPAKVLTLEESLELMVYKVNTQSLTFKDKPLSFSDKRRLNKNIYLVRRLDIDCVSETLQDFSAVHGFVMQSSIAVKLTGVGFYGRDGENPINYKIQVDLEFGSNIYVREVSMINCGKFFEVNILPKVPIPSNTKVLFKFSITGGPTYVSKETLEKQTKEIDPSSDPVMITTFDLSPGVPDGLKQVPWLKFEK